VPGGQLCLYRDWGEALPRARGALAAHVCYAVQQRPAGLCDALFRALPFVAPEEDVLVGLPKSDWIRGAFKLTGRILSELHDLWLAPGRRDGYVGTLVNAWLARGGRAEGIRAGEAYVDVGTLHGYRQAIELLNCAHV